MTSVLPTASTTMRQAGLPLQIACDSAERAAYIRSNCIEGGDGGDRDEAGDECIFDSRSSSFAFA